MPALPIGFAHRGARLEHPDNTLAGFARALELGATALETDAWVTADGVVVLDHDGVVRQGVRRRPLRSLVAADLPGHLPRLEDLYERCGTGWELSVDVKDPAAGDGLIAGARRHGAAGRLWVCSPSVAALQRWRPVDPDVRLVHSPSIAAVTGRRHPYRELGAEGVAEAVSAHVTRLVSGGIAALNLRHHAWNRLAVAAVHGAGAMAFGWDAQTADVLRRLVDHGIDAVYSDHVAVMVRVLAESRADPDATGDPGATRSRTSRGATPGGTRDPR